MIAPPPIPTVYRAKVATMMVYQNPAQAGNGKVRFLNGCPVAKRSRVCHVRITGDAPQNLRITVWETPSNYMLAARTWHAPNSRRRHELRVIQPYRGWLASTGACESSGGYSLRTGLHDIGGGGAYRGRYQMTFHIWAAVGGHGDPAQASWLEQAYRAIKVRIRYGRGQWPVCG